MTPVSDSFTERNIIQLNVLSISLAWFQKNATKLYELKWTSKASHTCTSDIFLFNLDPHPSEYDLSDFYNITINFLIIQSGIVYKSLSSVSYDAELLDVTGHLKDLPLIPMP